MYPKIQTLFASIVIACLMSITMGCKKDSPESNNATDAKKVAATEEPAAAVPEESALVHDPGYYEVPLREPADAENDSQAEEIQAGEIEEEFEDQWEGDEADEEEI